MELRPHSITVPGLNEEQAALRQSTVTRGAHGRITSLKYNYLCDSPSLQRAVICCQLVPAAVRVVVQTDTYFSCGLALKVFLPFPFSTPAPSTPSHCSPVGCPLSCAGTTTRRSCLKLSIIKKIERTILN